MRTTLNLDEQALESALRVAPGKTKTAVINEALREFAHRRRVRDLLRFEGKVHWEGNLDELRQRSGAAQREDRGDVSRWSDPQQRSRA